MHRRRGTDFPTNKAISGANCRDDDGIEMTLERDQRLMKWEDYVLEVKQSGRFPTAETWHGKATIMESATSKEREDSVGSAKASVGESGIPGGDNNWRGARAS